MVGYVPYYSESYNAWIVLKENGKPWAVMVAGPFPSKEQAKACANIMEPLPW